MSLFRKIKVRIEDLVRKVYPYPATFDEVALENREKYEDDYKMLACTLSNSINFNSVIDIGCAQGLLLEPLYEDGYDVYGIEISDKVIEFLPDKLSHRVEIGDFSAATGSFDLVCCIEVAEHIKPSRSEELVNRICSLSNQYVFFTAAPPGQKGHGHINCRPHSYWISLFAKHDFSINNEKTNIVRENIEEVNYVEWLLGNSFILEET